MAERAWIKYSIICIIIVVHHFQSAITVVYWRLLIDSIHAIRAVNVWAMAEREWKKFIDNYAMRKVFTLI